MIFWQTNLTSEIAEANSPLKIGHADCSKNISMWTSCLIMWSTSLLSCFILVSRGETKIYFRCAKWIKTCQVWEGAKTWIKQPTAVGNNNKNDKILLEFFSVCIFQREIHSLNQCWQQQNDTQEDILRLDKESW